MKELSELNIKILCYERGMYEAMKKEFDTFDNVEVVQDEFGHYMKENEDKVDCIVSPGNAFGYMTGGYDAAISDYLGWDFMEIVQHYINEVYFGEQPLGTSFLVDTSRGDLKLIHTPTMRKPSVIRDPTVIYNSMRTALICALQNEVDTVVLPPFGGGCGQMSPKSVAYCMKMGYLQVRDKKRAKQF